MHQNCMFIKPTLRYCIAFMAFVLLFGQLHEMAHLATVYLVCGCPGKQADFNLWTICATCQNNSLSFLATVAGPVFSYILMWCGFFMLKSQNKKCWPAGFVLVMGNLAFARVFTAAMGGGDETTVLRHFLSPQLNIYLVKIIGFIIVLLLAGPPIYMVYNRLLNSKVIGFMLTWALGPMIIMFVYEFKFLGKVIQAGVMAQAHGLGIADFIYLHTLVMFLVVLIYRKVLLKPADLKVI